MPDGRGGLWLVDGKQTLWMAKDTASIKVAEVGSVAGALAVDGDGALWLADGPKLLKLPLPRERTAKEREGSGSPREVAPPLCSPPELVADRLGDVYGVALAGDGTIVVSDWEGGRVLTLAPTEKESAKPRVVRVLASGLQCPSGVLACADGGVLVKESCRQGNVAARLQRIAADGKVTRLVELHRGAGR